MSVATKRRGSSARTIAAAVAALSVLLPIGKKCKGSIRYELPDDTPPDQKFKSPITNAYVSRAFLKGEPAQVKVEIGKPGEFAGTLLRKERDHTGSVRYDIAGDDPTAPVTNLYVNRSAFPEGMPDAVVVRVTF